MKAIRIYERGGPEKLIYEEVPKPVPQEGEALVCVHAVAITPSELSWSAYTPEHLPTVVGHDVSGVVETIGHDVTEVKIGDPVYALADFWRDGGAAEYIVVRAGDLAQKPRTVDHVHAAAVPTSALTAWQALFDHAGLVKGQRVLIHGASGGVGSYAVQLAHCRGLHVIGMASTLSLEYVRKLGAEEAIDYKAAPFEDIIHDADAVLDTVGGETRARSWNVLRPGGVLVSTVGPVSPEEFAQRGVRGMFFIVKPSRSQLIEIGDLIDAGAVRPMVAQILPLDQARQAFERGLRGHVQGKIVLRVIQ